MTYLAVIGDIVASRTARTRGELQRSLARALEHVNGQGAGRIASPYTITLGDEFQAVYEKPAGLLSDFWVLFEAIHPVQLRVSIGVGEITTALNKRQALGMDGPAFYRARQCMEGLKKVKGYAVQVNNGSPGPWLVNESLRLLARLVAGWKRETLSTLVSLSQGAAVGEMARRQHVTERAVFKRIRTNSLREVLGVAAAIEAELGDDMSGAHDH